MLNKYGQIDAKLGGMPNPQMTTPKQKYWRQIPNKQIGNEEQRPNQLLPNRKPKLKSILKTIVINPQ